MPILIGVHSDKRIPFEAAAGRVDTLRFFGTPGQAPTASPFVNARNAAIAGYDVCVSFKNPTSLSWAQVGSGSWDSQIDAFGNWMATVPPPPNPMASGRISNGHQMCFFHEMDNDADTAANYRAAANRVYQRLQAIVPFTPGWWQYTMIMTGGFNGAPFNNRDPDAYWPTTVPLQLLGADYYNQRGAQLAQGDVWADPTRPDRPHTDISFMLGKARGHGAKLHFPEYASSRLDPAIYPNDNTNQAGPHRRTAWILAGADMWRQEPDIYSIHYYDQDALDGRINWRISPGGVISAGEPNSITNFKSWGAGSISASPVVSSFTPTSGPVGTPVAITGTNFTGVTAVRFGGILASFVVDSATAISAVVPNGAVTGLIRVSTAADFDDSTLPFTVTEVPSSFLGAISPSTRVKAVGAS